MSFCVEGRLDPLCRTMTFDEFPDEKDIIVLILEYFKTFLPEILINKKDYYNKPIKIDPKDIDLVSRKNYGKYVVVLSIADDISSYPDEGFYQEDTEYVFQLDLQVSADDVLASLENLIKLKSAIKTMLVNMDNNLNVRTGIADFSYGNFGFDEANKLVRQGTYRFSILASNYKNNV